MPYLASLAQSFGRTTAYVAVAHPSLPNYLAIAAGSTFGITDDNPPADHHLGGLSVFDAVLAAGATAKAYLEGMPAPCSLHASGSYAVKHNPWAYFSDPVVRKNCLQYDIPAGTSTAGRLHDDVAAGELPTVGLLVPDTCNDAHDCPLKVADDWLRAWIPVIQRGPDYRSGRLAIVITFDEDDYTGGNTVLTTVIFPGTKHVTATQGLDHYSLAGYFAELGGALPPSRAASAPSFREMFHL